MEEWFSPQAMVAAGWVLTRRHPASSYGVPVVLAPDGEPVGDGEVILVSPEGSITDFSSDEGAPLFGWQLREILSDPSLPPWDADEEEQQ